VKWTIEQIIAAKSTAYLKGPMSLITAIETPDAKTVRLITQQPIVSLPYWFAMPQAPIISKDSPSVGADAIGAGPFVMTSNERGIGVKMEAFPNFYRPGVPKLKEMSMTVYVDDNLRVAALQAGDLDLIEYVPWQSIDSIAAAAPKRYADPFRQPFLQRETGGLLDL
jgi:peptide/nickel transport system substrate-binding protein